MVKSENQSMNQTDLLLSRLIESVSELTLEIRRNNQNLRNTREGLFNLEQRASRLENSPVQVERRSNSRHQASTRVNVIRDRRGEVSAARQETQIEDLIRITNSHTVNERFGTVTNITTARACFTFTESGRETYRAWSNVRLASEEEERAYVALYTEIKRCPP